MNRLRTKLREGNAALKAERKRLYEDPAIETKLADINGKAAAKVKTARCANGLYWGTYLIAEQRFTSPDGPGPTPSSRQQG